MTTFYTQQAYNVKKTWFFMTLFFVLIIAVGFALSVTQNNPTILYVSFFVSLFLNIFSYWFSDKLVLSLAHAKEIESKSDYPELWNVVENLSIASGLPMPKLYVIDDPAPNAFATGRDKDHAVIAVTTGILPLLNKSELEGVIAHEFSHIGNRDMLLQTIIVVFVGMISFVADIAFRMTAFRGDDERKNPIGLIASIALLVLAPIAATLLKLAISRKRELLADASAVLLTRYPEGLASALQKISQFHQPMRVQNHAIAHLFISDPSGINDEAEAREHEEIGWFQKLFMTHPPVEERVRALLGERGGEER